MRNIEVYKAQAAIESITSASKPGPALRAVMERGNADDASPFERYAANLLAESGALELTAPGRPELHLLRVGGGQLSRLNIGAAPTTGQEPVIVLENAINRLSGIVGALVEGVGSTAPAPAESGRARRRELFERHGVAYPLWSDTELGAHVVLPPLGSGEAPSASFFNEIDWRLLDTVANNAHVFFQAAILANRNQVIYGVKAPHCSEWDVRTRMASVLGSLEPPLRLTYRFDCDTARGTAAVHFSAPPIVSLPAIPDADADGATEQSSGLSDTARVAYSLRIAALVAAACFGSGRIIEHVLVTGFAEESRPLVSCTFDRIRFVQETLPAIDAAALSSPRLRFNPEEIAGVLNATHASFAAPHAPSPIPSRIDGTRDDPWDDARALPAELQRLFHARHVRDIDTTHYLGASGPAIDAAKADSTDSLLAAIAQLESVVDELEGALSAPDDAPDARPIYCANAISRAAIALLDDDLNVSLEAEAFLNMRSDIERPELPDVHYYRAPDALYHAHVGLADLYRKLGDVRGAELQADRCIALAPTTCGGYALKADALAGQGRFAEAVNVLMSGLRVAVAESDQALLLHDMALLFWRMGRRRDASALHIYTATLPGIYAAKSLEFVKQLAGGVNPREYLRDNMEEATRVMNELGIMLVSQRARNALIAYATLGLANAHMPRAAAPYAALLAERFPANRIIDETCNSIRYGLDRS